MKQLFLLLCICCFATTAMAQTGEGKSKPDPNSEVLTVDAACGQCRLGLKGKGCNLAVRIKDAAYFVDGTDIDSHGDAHAEDGFCNAVRKARVQGKVENGRFKATYFELVKTEK